MEASVIESTAFMNIESFHYENSYKRLCPSESGKLKKDVSFPTMWELFVWSAILGYINKCPKEINKRYGSPPFRWQVIKDPHQNLLILMAVESKKSFEIIRKPDELKKNIESHSNGGLDIVHQELALDNLAYKNIENLIYSIQKRITKDN